MTFLILAIVLTLITIGEAVIEFFKGKEGSHHYVILLIIITFTFWLAAAFSMNPQLCAR
jgi:hypothetical protein